MLNTSDEGTARDRRFWKHSLRSAAPYLVRSASEACVAS